MAFYTRINGYIFVRSYVFCPIEYIYDKVTTLLLTNAQTSLTVIKHQFLRLLNSMYNL